MRLAVALCLLVCSPLAGAQRPAPILDMHLHAYSAAEMGPPPVAICSPFDYMPDHDPADPPGAYAQRFMKAPPCSDPLWSPASDEELMRQTLEVLERRNVFAVTSGSLEQVRRWHEASPERIIPALQFALVEGAPSAAELRPLFAGGELRVFGEVVNQYHGVAPDDPRMEPYLAMLEELDIPINIHLGPGPPGVRLFHPTMEGYRASLHSALTLENMLRRHPRLRVYVAHAGWPMIDDMIAMLYTYPQLHVDLGVLPVAYPRQEFYRYLERLVSAGFGRRILFGSDQMVWPQMIEVAIEVIEAAPFLTAEQKRDIFYENAARFLRLSEEERARHRGTPPADRAAGCYH
jgi:uncharacterized protein